MSAPLTGAQASARARKTRKPVVVSSLTTPDSLTRALPNGQMSVTENLTPVRTLRRGRWLSLNPRLSNGQDGRLISAVTEEPVTLSAGGTSPLATLDNAGRTLALSWPGTLPDPSVSGATATYANIEPGINLAVTANSQGGISDVIVVQNAAAAASAGLSTALQLTATAPGMSIETEPDGSLAATTGPGALPAFTAADPQVWDSAGPPAATPTTSEDGATVTEPSGLPAYSAITAPGAFAHVGTATQTVTGSTITVTPPAGFLTSASTVYPVYIDPDDWQPNLGQQNSVDGDQWTQIDEGEPSDDGNQDGGWDISGAPYLEVGYCDNAVMDDECGSIGVVRSMFRFSLPSLPSDTKVSQANVFFDDLWQYPDCAAEPLQLWLTPSFSATSTWNNDSSWGSASSNELEQETITGFGYSGCPSSDKDVDFGSNTGASGGSAGNLATHIQDDLDNPSQYISLGLRASDENTSDAASYEEWRYFQDKASDILLQYDYYYAPAQPVLYTNPGNKCQTSSGSASIVGDDILTVTADVSDTDSDPGLVTTVTLYNSSGTAIAGPDSSQKTGTATGVTLATLPEGTMPAAGTYTLKASTTDSFNEKSSTETCYINYNPSAPAPPSVAGIPASGETVTIPAALTGLTFSPGQSCTGTPDPCPVNYSYQLGDEAPVTGLTANSSGSWVQPSDEPININSPGVYELDVTGINSAGNPSGITSIEITADLPATAMPDGYYTDGSFPALLSTDAGASDQSLWLSQGTANSQLAPATEIGGLGTGASTDGGDGPADWNGAEILHGNFMGDGYQDVMAYYTTQNAIVLHGSASTSPLNPYSGNALSKSLITWCDASGPGGLQCLAGDSGAPEPTDLVYAGNASQLEVGGIGSTDGADVIGIWGSGDAYELDLYTATEPGSYGFNQLLANAGQATPSQPAWLQFMLQNWQDFTLASAELPDAAYPQGDPSNTVLFALDTATGNTYTGDMFASVNSGCATGTCSSTSLIGMPSTWVQVTGTPASWTTTPPKLSSADVNNGASGPGSGQPEIWTVTTSGTNGAASTATSYDISGIDTTDPQLAPGTVSSLGYPSNAWDLDYGAANPGQSSTGYATDSITGSQDPITGTTYGWGTDAAVGGTFDTPGNNFISPPDNTVATSDTQNPVLSVWFKTTATNGVIASLQSTAVKTGGSVTGDYTPILYIGTDGRLNAEWYNSTAVPVVSNNAVDDGLWHHAVLTATTSGGVTTQTLYIDGQAQGTAITGNINFSWATDTNLTFAAGYIGGNWPDESNYKYDGNDARVMYYDGDLADITFTS